MYFTNIHLQASPIGIIHGAGEADIVIGMQFAICS
jgi:hypothetical protein